MNVAELNNNSINNFNFINYAIKILENRSNDSSRSYEERKAYENAVQIIKYAKDKNYDCLKEFDY